MALHTHGNLGKNPAHYTIRSVNTSYNPETNSEDVNKVGNEFTLPSHNSRVGKLHDGYFMRCDVESYSGTGSRDESYEPIKLLRMHFNDEIVSLSDLFLFLGYYSKIKEGKMPNEVGVDWLDVVGESRSETYTCPDTVQYRAADSDYFWFQEDGTPIQVTTRDLYYYDISRTPVKYDDDVPNYIRAIGILKPGIALTAEERDYLFQLLEMSIFWDDNLAEYGHLKNKDDAPFGYNPYVVELVDYHIYYLYYTTQLNDNSYLDIE